LRCGGDTLRASGGAEHGHYQGRQETATSSFHAVGSFLSSIRLLSVPLVSIGSVGTIIGRRAVEPNAPTDRPAHDPAHDLVAEGTGPPRPAPRAHRRCARARNVRPPGPARGAVPGFVPERAIPRS